MTAFASLLEILLSAQGHHAVVARRPERLPDLAAADPPPDLVLLHTGRGHAPAPPGFDWPPLVGAVAEPLLLILARTAPVADQPAYRLACLAALPVRDTQVLALVRAALPPR
ncbi:MAG TPA: hypothetical protein VIO14_09815 [Dehalococcoidia bacterium]